ncbi:MAG: DNA repair protein, partial [Nitrosopumilus sp.]|nr:DNA repair protein [Nitrosopumilus sp.]
MGLFGKKKKEEVETISQNSEEYVLKEELESEVEKLQQEYRAKQSELEEITQKIKSVKEEYDSTVENLMLVKKELNQKKM